SYLGGWPEYARIRDERRAGTAPEPGVTATSGANAPSAAAPGAASTPEAVATAARAKKQRRQKPSGPSKNRLGEQEKATLAVEEAEASMRALEEELADPAAWATKYESAKSEARHTAARRAVEDAYARLEALID
ncbi:MAG TPA: ABC transporter ATP-binding protein, partial [Solirubrobacteraceae bacterium]|nr:ABC transporter ATP-binding protein [Solirubrobacteraceae bacterium]